MFTESARVGCSFQVCRGGTACLIFYQSSLTLGYNCGLCPPGNQLVLSPVLSYTVTILSRNTCWPAAV